MLYSQQIKKKCFYPVVYEIVQIEKNSPQMFNNSKIVNMFVIN